MSTYNCKWCKDTKLYIGAGLYRAEPCQECCSSEKPASKLGTGLKTCDASFDLGAHRDYWDHARERCSNCGALGEDLLKSNKIFRKCDGNLDNAVGERLDKLGALRNLPRNGRTDTYYRCHIKTDMWGPQYVLKRRSSGRSMTVKRW